MSRIGISIKNIMKTKNNKRYPDLVMSKLKAPPISVFEKHENISPPWGKQASLDGKEFQKTMIHESLKTIHDEGLRLTVDSYLKLVKYGFDVYNILPDDVKCQELELAFKLA